MKNDSTSIFYDNNSSIALSKNNGFHNISKHIDTRFHFIFKLVKDGEINIQFCGSKDQLYDIFTKSLGRIPVGFQ